MEHPPRPAPVVTVHSAQGSQVLDVLEDEPDEPARCDRRWVLAGVALLAVTGLVAGGVELEERRTAAAEERRAAAVVELELRDAGWGGTARAGGGSLRVDVEVRNDGPRDVEVTGASWAGFALVRPVRVRAGGARQLALELQVDCGAGRPERLAVGDDVELQVRTASTIRTVRTRMPKETPAATFDAAEAERLCGFFPLSEAVFVGLQGEALSGDAVVLQVDVSAGGGSRIDLVSLGPGPGLTAVLRAGAGPDPVPLPVALQVGQPQTFVTTAYEVVLTVADCAAAQAVPSAAVLRVGTRDGGGDTFHRDLAYEPALRAALVAASCPG